MIALLCVCIILANNFQFCLYKSHRLRGFVVENLSQTKQNEGFHHSFYHKVKVKVKVYTSYVVLLLSLTKLFFDDVMSFIITIKVQVNTSSRTICFCGPDVIN